MARCRYMELSVIVHATEDLDAVYRALEAFFGSRPYVFELLEGHYGNPIFRITSFAEDCDGLLDRLCKAAPGLDRYAESRRGPAGEYYIRLDKQALAVGEARPTEADDAVRIKVRTRGPLCT